MPIYSQYDVPNSENMINLGVGQPATSELPLEWFKLTLQNLSNTLDNPEFLQYGAISGYNKIKEKLATWLTDKYYLNIKKILKVEHLITKEQLFMTNGNTGALQLIIDTFVETGDEIIIEDPTYFIAKDIFENYGLNINSVPMEEDGINIELLEEKINDILNNDVKNLQNKIFLYLIPIHHNPTSITLSHAKRLKIGNLCHKYHKLYVIADEVYHFLNFDSSEYNLYYPLADYHDKIITLGSFSKLIAPGLRVGWLYQKYTENKNLSLIDNIIKSSILDSSGGINPFGFKIIETAITNKTIDTIINKNILMLKQKCQLLVDFLQEHNIKFTIPNGGYFIWIELDVNTFTFLEFAIKYKVKFQPGIKFGNCNTNLRISFSYYDTDDLLTGISRLLEAYSMYNKIKVSICGATGRLGSLIKNQIDNNSKLHFLENIKRTIKVNTETNIIIDVSSEFGTLNLIKYLLDNKINKPIIIGTTGLTPKTIDYLRIYSINNPVAIISNFSERISKIKKIMTELDSLDDNWKFSMSEKDYPSGTASILKSICNRDYHGEVIGFHELKCYTQNEEIIISHNAKSRNIFAEGCINFIPKLMKKAPGLYYNFDSTETDYKIYTSLGNKFLISTKNSYLSYFLKEDKECDYFILLNIVNSNYDWNIFNKTGLLDKSNGNDLLVISKYLNDNYNIKNGEIGDKPYIFKFEKNKYHFQMEEPKQYTLKEEYTNNLSQLINQLTGLNVLGISKYNMDMKHLVIEIKEDLFGIDTEIINTICSIINGEGNNIYNVSFINLLEDDIIRLRYYDSTKGKESDGNVNSCMATFDYYATINEIGYDSDFYVTILLNKDNVKVYYKDNKYFISF